MLRKLTVLASGEPGEASDLELAQEKLRAVHGYLKAEGLVRWTLNDLPDFAEEPYVMMASFYAAPEFMQAPNPTFWAVGLRQIQSAITLPSGGTVYTEYY